jgi:hypothetical protein
VDTSAHALAKYIELNTTWLAVPTDMPHLFQDRRANDVADPTLRI